MTRRGKFFLWRANYDVVQFAGGVGLVAVLEDRAVASKLEWLGNDDLLELIVGRPQLLLEICDSLVPLLEQTIVRRVRQTATMNGATSDVREMRARMY